MDFRFIKLHTVSGASIMVNVLRIDAFTTGSGGSGTHIYQSTDDPLVVRESPAQILDMLTEIAKEA